jgi:hypothetical protein
MCSGSGGGGYTIGARCGGGRKATLQDVKPVMTPLSSASGDPKKIRPISQV